ncbi:MAG: DUF1573 domain-containing protein [Deltaproteobacteria bacterium]|jgi:hypothetical protein|nr:DUF1573 domain-containing protein [Deltaproteobacteria bacterium]
MASVKLFLFFALASLWLLAAPFSPLQAQNAAEPAEPPATPAEGAPPESPPSAEAAAVPERPGPRISFDELQFEGGLTPAGNTIKHSFNVANLGDEALIIEQVIPNCGCTVASFDDFIAPGQVGKINVNVDLYREWAGQEYLKSVTVISNDPDLPRQRLAMHGRIGPYKPVAAATDSLSPLAPTGGTPVALDGDAPANAQAE